MAPYRLPNLLGVSLTFLLHWKPTPGKLSSPPECPSLPGKVGCHGEFASRLCSAGLTSKEPSCLSPVPPVKLMQLYAKINDKVSQNFESVARRYKTIVIYFFNNKVHTKYCTSAILRVPSNYSLLHVQVLTSTPPGLPFYPPAYPPTCSDPPCCLTHLYGALR